MLTKKDKEELVIKLYKDGKTFREIASAAHLSFSDIKKITRNIDGYRDIGLSNKSKATQALHLFKSGKKPIEVAIELNLSVNEVHDLQQEFWALTQLGELALIYYEIRNHLDLFLKLYHTLRKNRSITQKDIGRLLRYAVYDLPSLENRIQRLTSDAIDMEWRKKQSKDEIAIMSSSISQLKNSLNRNKIEIEEKKETISNLNRQLNQKSLCLDNKSYIFMVFMLPCGIILASIQ
jgi:hypothetical protein